ncbi:Chemotaxis protein CheA [Jannaschia seosinensis]|uniref:Chemotaxis protein CheA n=1 Tax=Jannaschia seosinensis TaxID=313367 RepID=A0A0M7BF40_9RHOB|nr:chemotaxis protein CheA [Jannaschia seosinensis]CUH40533.1 Chemotaxis protein CheA [Jannaschia seosinensis]
MDPMEAIRATFFEECTELLETLEAGLLALQAGTHDTDTVDAVFRAVHSIKGGAGAFDLTDLVAFAHEFENALDGLRNKRLPTDASVLAVMLRAGDQLGDQVTAARDGYKLAPDTSELKKLVSTETPTHAAPESLSQPTSADATAPEFTPITLDIELDSDFSPAVGTRRDSEKKNPKDWLINFEPLPDLLASGNEPLYLFRALEVLGQINVEAIDSDLDLLDNLDVAIPRLRWKIVLNPTAGDLTETEIENVFEFAVDLCVLKIDSAQPESAPPKSKNDTHSANRVPPPKCDTEIPGSIIDDSISASPEVVQAIPPNSTPSAVSASIRVDLSRVDRLVNLVGELVISQSMLAQEVSTAGLNKHSEALTRLDDLQQLTRDMQDSVMAIRAQPVRSLFQRMTRIVRETAQATGKSVQLVTSGEETEIDKTVVERLADPLTHIIRNAIDHGIEEATIRDQTGKSPLATVRLTARQSADRVVIEVSDDGRGIDRPRVLARAIERGLVANDAVLNDSEIDHILFLPGFSTTNSISKLSGRGVGMDVVQKSIRDLNVTVVIASEQNKGCTISISLPLTLAILDGMVVRDGNQRVVIPLSAIVETQIEASARIEALDKNRRLALLHDQFVPVVDLSEGMGFCKTSETERAISEQDSALLFVTSDEGGTFALRVDAIEAQRQVVIKGLDESFGRVPCVSAATILGNGQVALIVNPAGIASRLGLDRQITLGTKFEKPLNG